MLGYHPVVFSLLLVPIGQSVGRYPPPEWAVY